MEENKGIFWKQRAGTGVSQSGSLVCTLSMSAVLLSTRILFCTRPHTRPALSRDDLPTSAPWLYCTVLSTYVTDGPSLGLVPSPAHPALPREEGYLVQKGWEARAVSPQQRGRECICFPRLL